MNNINKYQEALNFLSENCYIESEEYDYDENLEFSYFPSGEEETRTLQELIDSYKKYRWQNIISGKCYPPSDGRYLCKIEYQNTFIYMVCEWSNYDGFVLDFQFPEGTYEIVAFKRIEEFEGEK